MACRTALVDLGLEQVDPGLVPDGARCGTDKVRFENVHCRVMKLLLYLFENFENLYYKLFSGAKVSEKVDQRLIQNTGT